MHIGQLSKRKCTSKIKTASLPAPELAYPRKNNWWNIHICTITFFLLFTTWGCGGPPAVPPQKGVGIEMKEEALPTPTIKVYVENSGSMDGYVKGVTDFENAVYSYLSDLQLADLGQKDSASFKNRLELNYINSEVLTHKSDVEEFIKKLEPKTFRMRGGNRNTSDISDILEKILERMESPNDISILISDCIFSPGKRYKSKDNADEYLVAQQIGIRNHLTEYLIKESDLAVIVMRLMSQFEGYYYNKFDDKTYINDNRPFFICLLGNKKQLKKIMDTINMDRIKGGGVQNVFMISKPGNPFNYGIQPQKGYTIDMESPKNTVKNAKVEDKEGISRFQLAINVDFSECLLENTYIMNPDNYSVSNKAYSLEVNKSNATNSTYTHVLKLNLERPIISKGSVKITLLKKQPTWIGLYTDEEGLDIHAPDAMEKTYGLKYLMEGIYDAYSSDEEYGSITVNIK